MTTTTSAATSATNIGALHETVPAQCNHDTVPDKKPHTMLDIICLVLLFIGVLLTMFMVSLTSTIVAPAMTIIATDLEALEQQTWIVTAYLVALNASQPVSGKFSDIFGRKPVLLFGLSLFVLGALISALTPTANGLIAGRALQGFGGGTLFSVLFIIVTDIAPVDWRPCLQSMLIVVYGLASVVGPLIGGSFVDYLTWRWDFWLNVVLGGVALAILAVLFKESGVQNTESLSSKLKRVDYIGSILSIGFIVCLLLALNWGPSYGWGNAHSIATFVMAGILLILLIIVEGWLVKEPLLPPEVLLNPKVFFFYIYMACLGFGFMPTLYMAPIMFQSVFGASSSESGIKLIPYMCCLMAGSFASGILIKHFPYIKMYVMIGAASNLIGYGLFYTVDETANWGRQAGFLTFCGLALGLSQQNCTLGVQTAAGKEFMAVATSINNWVLMMASSISIAVCQTVFTTVLKEEYKSVSTTVLQIAAKYGALGNYLFIRDMPVEAQGPIIHTYMTSLNKVFIVPLIAAGIGFICACFISNIRYNAGALPGNKDNHDVEKVKLGQ